MPWIIREPSDWRSRLRRRVRHWRYDHSEALTVTGVGVACSTAALAALKVVGLLG